MDTHSTKFYRTMPKSKANKAGQQHPRKFDPPIDYDDDDDDGNGSRNSNSKFTTDKFGNTITKVEAKQREEAERMRAEAKARRLAKAKAKAKEDETKYSSDNADNNNNADNNRPQWLLDYDKVKAKLKAGKKLSGKDKKLLKRGEARMEEDKALGITYNGDDGGNNQNGDDQAAPTKELLQRLKGFSLSFVPTRGGAGGNADVDDEDNTAGPTTTTTTTSSSSSSNNNSKDVVIQGISISAPQKPLLVNADLKLSHGRRYGLIGANGRGKSTLLRFLAARLLPVPSTLDVLLVEQEAPASAHKSVLGEVLSADVQRTSLLQQEQQLLLALEKHDENNVRVEVLVAELTAVVDELDAIGAEGAEARARAILSGLGFTESMVEDPTHKLSGGWRMRVSLARALFVAPKLLLLDEPTNHLDLDAVLWLDQYLTTRFPETSTVLTVSHDRDFLDETCTDLVLLTDDGGLEYHKGNLQKLNEGASSRAAKRAKDYALQQKMLKAERAKHPSVKIEKLQARIATKLGVPRLAEKMREYKVHFDLKAPPNAKTSAGLSVDLRDVQFSYGSSDRDDADRDRRHKGAFVGFQKLNLSIDSHTRAAIVGANGSGKTTLLKLMAGKLQPQKGEVQCGRKLVIGYYDQHFSELQNCGNKVSAVDYLLSKYNSNSSLLSSSGGGGAAQEARKWLGKFGLDSARHVMPLKDLSGGQKARVCFASIALLQPHLLILDEPTNHLDLESIDALIQGLQEYKGGVLAVSHDAWLVDALSKDADGYDTPLWVCKDSKVIVEKGGFAKYRRDLEAAAIAREKQAKAIARQRASQRAKERREKLARLRNESK